MLELLGLGVFCFWKCSNFNVDSKNEREDQKNDFTFQDDFVSIGNDKFSVFSRE